MRKPSETRASLMRFIWPFCSSSAVLVCALLVYYLAARRFGIDGFSEYSLTRRTLSLLQPLLPQAIGLALTHHVALTGAATNGRRIGTYFCSALSIVLAFQLAVLAAAFFFPTTIARFLFGDVRQEKLVLPAAVMLMGLSLHGVAYAHLRGLFLTGHASLLEALNAGILPLLAMMAFGWSAASVLWSTGIATMICSLVAISRIYTRLSIRITDLRAHLMDIAHYAIPRIPGACGLAALFALPATITAHLDGVRVAGNVAFAMTLLTLVGSVVSPIGIALMPYATRKMACGEIASLRRLVGRIMAATTILSICAIVVFEIFTPAAIRWFFGADEATLCSVTRLMALATLPYTLYLGCRSLLDGASTRAINAKNALVSLLLFVLIAGLVAIQQAGLSLLLMGWIVSVWLLAGLTIADSFRIVHDGPTESLPTSAMARAWHASGFGAPRRHGNVRCMPTRAQTVSRKA